MTKIAMLELSLSDTILLTQYCTIRLYDFDLLIRLVL